MALSDNPTYVAANTKAGQLYIELYGSKGTYNTGLAGAMAQYREDSRYGVNSSQYKKAKAEFDAKQIEYNKQNAIWQGIKAKEDKAAQTIKDRKTAAASSTAAHTALGDAQAALASAQEQNLPIATIQQLQQAVTDATVTANNAETNAGGKATLGKGNPNLPQVKTDPLMTDYVVSDVNGNTYVTGLKESKEFFFVPPIAGGNATPTNDITAARSKVLESIGIKKLPALLDALYASRFITKTQLKTQDYTAGLDAAIRQYSVNALQEYQLGGGTGAFPSMDSFLKKYTIPGTSLAGTKSAAVDFTTTRAAADRDINLYMIDLTGSPATAAQKEDYFKRIAKAESTSVNTTTTTTDAAGTVKDQKVAAGKMSAADYEVIKATVAKSALAGTPVDKLLNAKTPGQIATDVNNVLKYSSDYALNLTPQQALQYVSDAFGQPNYLSKVQDRMKQLAIQTMPNLAAHLTAGGTVKDVADVYGSIKAKKLGITIPDSTADGQIMSSINLKGGMLNMSDFERQLQADPLWRKTAEAHQVATDFTNTILQSFGFGGN